MKIPPQHMTFHDTGTEAMERRRRQSHVDGYVAALMSLVGSVEYARLIAIERKLASSLRRELRSMYASDSQG